MYRTPVRADKILKETEPELQGGGPLTDGTLKRMPQSHMVVHQRYNPDSTEFFTNSSAVAQVYNQGKVKGQPNHAVPVSEKPEINTDIRIQVQETGPKVDKYDPNCQYDKHYPGQR